MIQRAVSAAAVHTGCATAPCGKRERSVEPFVDIRLRVRRIPVNVLRFRASAARCPKLAHAVAPRRLVAPRPRAQRCSGCHSLDRRPGMRRNSGSSATPQSRPLAQHFAHAKRLQVMAVPHERFREDQFARRGKVEDSSAASADGKRPESRSFLAERHVLTGFPSDARIRSPWSAFGGDYVHSVQLLVFQRSDS